MSYTSSTAITWIYKGETPTIKHIINRMFKEYGQCFIELGKK